MGDNKQLYLEVFKKLNENAADQIKGINDSHLINMTALLNSHNEVQTGAQQAHERTMQTINSNHVKNIAALDSARSTMYSNHEQAMTAIADNRASQMAAIENARNNNSSGGLLGDVMKMLGGGSTPGTPGCVMNTDCFGTGAIKKK